MDWKQFENETTEELVLYIQWKDQPDYKEASKAAFVAFCFRFREDLLKKCKAICSRHKYDIDVAIEIANRVFHKFWLKPNYDDKKRKMADTFDEGIRYYLYGIANNELINFYRTLRDPNPYIGDEQIVWNFPENLESLKPERKKELEERREIIEMALSRLGPKHKPIYLTYLIHGKVGKNLPKNLIRKMQDEFGLAQGTIRYYLFEARNAVNDYLKIWDKAKK